ncbi:MAG: alginate export family protein [Mucinivorans sp.]
MKSFHITIVILAVLLTTLLGARGQSNNALSIYEGQYINSITFRIRGLPDEALAAQNLKQKIEAAFRLYPQTQYNSFMADYYVGQISILPFVESVILEIENSSQGGINLMVVAKLRATDVEGPKRESLFTSVKSFPLLYNSQRTYLTLKAAASEMIYSNSNAWFSRPETLTQGNPLAHHPVGLGYTAWVEGFASVGIYGITNIIPRANFHIYGGFNYLASFSTGTELFTDKSRFYGDWEQAYLGFIGGGRTSSGHVYRYNALYGRKQFILGDGFILINTSMNGDNRAALQLNPRWAAKKVFQASFMWDRLFIQVFNLQANELPTLSSETVISGLNVELGNKDRLLVGASFLHVPSSRFKYYLADGTTRSRQGLQLYNIRVFKNAPLTGSGFFFKTEVAWQRNSNFNMSAWAFYGELGWNFQQRLSLSYRFAYFGGDNPKSDSYNRWDALYTGGNGEQWVQGSNMYKIVQNSNEMSHRLQLIYNPVRRLQLVGQVWLFYAPQTNNIGGNPALTELSSKFYGAELNLTLKYFHSRHWYFHLNTAYTLPGGAIRNNVPGAHNWFCLSAFARYSF